MDAIISPPDSNTCEPGELGSDICHVCFGFTIDCQVCGGSGLNQSLLYLWDDPQQFAQEALTAQPDGTELTSIEDNHIQQPGYSESRGDSYEGPNHLPVIQCRRHTKSKAQIELLNYWFEIDPSPSGQQLAAYARSSGLEKDQVRNWFINQRRPSRRHKNKAVARKNDAVRFRNSPISDDFSKDFIDLGISDNIPPKTPRMIYVQFTSQDLPLKLSPKWQRSKDEPCPVEAPRHKPSKPPHICNVYICSICYKEYCTEKDWRRHETERHHPGPRWVCSLIPFVQDLDGGSWICTICDESFSNWLIFTEHSCQVCGVFPGSSKHKPAFDDYQELAQHVMKHHGTVLSPFMIESWNNWNHSRSYQVAVWSCSTCGIWFDDWEIRLDHIAEHFHESWDPRDGPLAIRSNKWLRPLLPNALYMRIAYLEDDHLNRYFDISSAYGPLEIEDSTSIIDELEILGQGSQSPRISEGSTNGGHDFQVSLLCIDHRDSVRPAKETSCGVKHPEAPPYSKPIPPETRSGGTGCLEHIYPGTKSQDVERIDAEDIESDVACFNHGTKNSLSKSKLSDINTTSLEGQSSEEIPRAKFDEAEPPEDLVPEVEILEHGESEASQFEVPMSKPKSLAGATPDISSNNIGGSPGCSVSGPPDSIPPTLQMPGAWMPEAPENRPRTATSQRSRSRRPSSRRPKSREVRLPENKTLGLLDRARSWFTRRVGL